MPKYKAGVAGPIPLEDGRVVTADQGPFDLELPTAVEGEFSHDLDLIERGVIVATDEPVASAPVVAAPAAPAAQSTTPAAGATTAASGQKAGE